MDLTENNKQAADLIKKEVDELTVKVRSDLDNLKKIAIAEAWKVLQVVIASIVQIIEIIGTDLASPDKKKLAMDLVSRFYDNVFKVVDVPFIPGFVEPIMHRYIKAFLMILASASIDATVTIFRNTGVFIKKYS